jgi:Cu(I)/Ag(I) efflux system membrane fusion protein
MNTRPLVIALALAGIFGAGGFAAYRIGVAQGMRQTASAEPHATSAKSAALKPGDIDPANGKRILYWHDPMTPGQKFDKPGKSPYMDMELVPVYADTGSDRGSVAIDARVQQNFGVRTARVTRGTLATRVEAVGNVGYNERDVAVVQARSNGFIERLYVRAPLDPVRRGQALAEVYVPDWLAAQEEYLSALRIARADPTAFGGLVDAARQRMRLAGMTEAQIARVEATGAVQARTILVAPIGGVVTELAAREGMTVMTGAALFRINGLRTVWVNAEVPETAAAHVRPGTRVQATATALPGQAFDGKVGAILPEVNATTRTLKARIELANPHGHLVPGMFARVDFARSEAKSVLLVPTEAIIPTGKRTVVIVAQAGGRFAPVDVEIGAESDGHTEVRTGLNEGQAVVVSGQFLIDSEASLRATVNRMGAASAPAHANDAAADVPHEHAPAATPAPAAHDHAATGAKS